MLKTALFEIVKNWKQYRHHSNNEHLYSGNAFRTLFSNKGDWTTNTCNNLESPHNHV